MKPNSSWQWQMLKQKAMPSSFSLETQTGAQEKLFHQEGGAALRQIPIEQVRSRSSQVFKMARLVWFSCQLCSKQKAGLRNLQRSFLSNIFVSLSESLSSAAIFVGLTKCCFSLQPLPHYHLQIITGLTELLLQSNPSNQGNSS